MKYRITIYEADSKGIEKIIDIKEFYNRTDLQNYIDKLNIEPKPYKLNKKQKGYTLTA